MSQPILYLVDDDGLHRRALARLLKAGGYAVADFRTAEGFLAALDAEPEPRFGPRCLILDLDLPGYDGLELQAILHQKGIRIPIVFLSGQGDIASSVSAIKAGALDFLTKPVAKNLLFPAVSEALRRYEQDILDEPSPNGALVRQRFETLTDRERAVLRLLVRGFMNKQVAGELEITERTVKAHRA